MYGTGYKLDLNHDLTFNAHNCECHSIGSMFRVLGMYNFGRSLEFINATMEEIFMLKSTSKKFLDESSREETVCCDLMSFGKLLFLCRANFA